MANYFLDTSALVKHYHVEKGTAEVEFDSLLSHEVEKRPTSYSEITVDTGTMGDPRRLYGVIDLNDLGFLILYPEAISIAPSREKAVQELQQFEQSGYIEDELRSDIKDLVAGGNPWTTDHAE